MDLEEVRSVILLALGCFLALFVQLGDLGRQLCNRRRGEARTRSRGGKEVQDVIHILEVEGQEPNSPVSSIRL